MIKQPIWLSPMNCTIAVSLCLGHEMGPTDRAQSQGKSHSRRSHPIQHHPHIPLPPPSLRTLGLPPGMGCEEGTAAEPCRAKPPPPHAASKGSTGGHSPSLTCTAPSWADPLLPQPHGAISPRPTTHSTAFGCPNAQSSNHPSLQLPPSLRLNGVPGKPLPQPPSQLPGRLSPLDGSREPRCRRLRSRTHHHHPPPSKPVN